MSDCQGTGQVWLSGGKCPECRRTANGLINLFGVHARAGDGGLAPRVPTHPSADTDVTKASLARPGGPVTSDFVTASNSQVLDGVTRKSTPAKPSASTPSRPARASRRVAAAIPAPASSAPVRKAKPEAKSSVKTTGQVPRTRNTANPLTKEFTPTIKEYLVWLEKLTGPFGEMDPNRLAGIAITMYGKYQISPERREAKKGKS
jgi:hypothetical protein